MGKIDVPAPAATKRAFRRPLAKVAAIAVAMALALYLAAVGYLFVFQRSYVFVPSGELVSPAQSGLPSVQVVTITAGDGTQLDRLVRGSFDWPPDAPLFPRQRREHFRAREPLQAGPRIPASDCWR